MIYHIKSYGWKEKNMLIYCMLYEITCFWWNASCQIAFTLYRVRNRRPYSTWINIYIIHHYLSPNGVSRIASYHWFKWTNLPMHKYPSPKEGCRIKWSWNGYTLACAGIESKFLVVIEIEWLSRWKYIYYMMTVMTSSLGEI